MGATNRLDQRADNCGPNCPTQVAGLYHCPACFEPYAPTPPEWAIQADFVRCAPRSALVVHNSNNQATRATGAKVKALGVQAGMPDLTIYCPGGRILLIELKTETGTLRRVQKERHAQLSQIGFTVATCHSLKAAIHTLQDFLANTHH